MPLLLHVHVQLGFVGLRVGGRSNAFSRVSR
jgi:hypothetical protein